MFTSPIGSLPSKALSLHFSTLVKVELGYFSGSFIILEILCLCSRLEVLHAGSVSAKHVVEREPWVCQQLRELEIWFQFEESEQDLHQLVFERLSTLIRLDRLKMKYDESFY